jgi:flagellar assembly protein FliH
MLCRIYQGSETPESIVWRSLDQPDSGGPGRRRAETPAPAEIDRSPEEASRIQAQMREARAAGLAEGKKAAAAEIEPVVERLSRGIAELTVCRSRLRKQAEDDLVKLALAIAKRILRRELSIDPDALKGVVAAALERIQARDVCTVHAHPDDAPAIERHIHALGVSTQILPDKSLRRGDLLIDTSRGTLDASLDTQLAEIERGLTDRLSR